eukprot:gb/GFBE01066299.1/.p1 GENE.gb/GFBE01066299.1/~~gb/GFBE01066299.1/.p1  ORF type:complete len:300 (+),score=62.76 gb/GFBE01066299.1/:1-900(+)
MDFHLGYRFTFLEVHDKEDGDTTCLRPRSRSMPADRFRWQTGESFTDNYVSSLAERARELHQVMCAKGVKEIQANHKSIKADYDTSGSVWNAPTSCSLPPVSNEEVGLVPTSSTLPAVTWTAGTLPKVDEGELPLEAAPNGGSVGHPEICRRPCMFLASGSCMNGFACGYCHLPHTEKPVHLDKRQRELITKLSRARMLELITRHVRARAAKKNMLDDASELLCIMQDWTRQEITNEDIPTHKKILAKLDHVLGKMNIAGLVGHALRCCSQEGEFLERVSGAMQRMRSKLASADLQLEA